ncbi:hypothetical protein N7471_010406 [Penicillium samsonianum]|uniref:uncharacterized protein n=1 Tax=Penicillium samsonianum TaxID=1882272 RepID=UPI002548CE86|nr:uncharacterized protein N7471_010406 [Penicillium samsonianum]KAJ6125913.1 hypothetical protein N7471_010406 [Penicillium samsonianum]
MTVIATIVEEASPPEIQMQDTACSNPETLLNNRSNWPSTEYSGLNSRTPTSNTGTVPISNNATREGSQHARRALKMCGGLDVAGKVVEYKATCRPKTISRGIHGSLRESMLHTTSKRPAECQISGLFPMDDFDLPKCRDSQFRSLAMADAGV